MTRRRTAITVAIALTAITALGAAYRAQADKRPAPITHVVLFELHDPAERAQLIAECDEALAGLDSVASYACGEPLDTGRLNANEGYHVGLYVGFNSVEDYEAYRNADAHIDLARKWRSKSKSMRIFDFYDPEP